MQNKTKGGGGGEKKSIASTRYVAIWQLKQFTAPEKNNMMALYLFWHQICKERAGMNLMYPNDIYPLTLKFLFLFVTILMLTALVADSSYFNTDQPKFS